MMHKNMQLTYHDPNNEYGGQKISLNSYLGIDTRGKNKLAPLVKQISRSSIRNGQQCGSGLLSSKSKRIDLKFETDRFLNENHNTQESFFPKSRRTIFGDKHEDDMNNSLSSFNNRRHTIAQTPTLGLSSNQATIM